MSLFAVNFRTALIIKVFITEFFCNALLPQAKGGDSMDVIDVIVAIALWIFLIRSVVKILKKLL